MEAEAKLVDNWRFSKRMPSRVCAIRELLELIAEGFDRAEDGSKSKGVVLATAAQWG
jgi:hypothetical protein